MWLIDTETYELEAVPGPQGYKYAILSHTWRPSGEPSYQDMRRGITADPMFDKVKETCYIAKARGIRYAWVDTCCIDKTSSAELTEAINSMFRWYKQSAVCYAYLSDVDRGSDPSHTIENLSRSRWFTRGWTLQELIAPEHLVFYSAD